jgi:hypothetical protein
MTEKWKVSGTYFEACNCVLACPCVFPNSPNIPTGGDCTVLVGWHIEQGLFAGVALGGLNVAMAIYSPGDMGLGNWKVALYLDERASGAQKDALTQIFNGQAGGQMAGIAPAIGQMLGVSSKKMEYQAKGRTRSLEIAGISKAEIEAIEGLDGTEITLNNLASVIAPGYPIVQAQSRQLSYHDYGMNWEISGKNGFYSPFTYQAG